MEMDRGKGSLSTGLLVVRVQSTLQIGSVPQNEASSHAVHGYFIRSNCLAVSHCVGDRMACSRCHDQLQAAIPGKICHHHRLRRAQLGMVWT